MITFVIATRNRAALLDEALASLVAQHPIREPWGILVVDNGSSDETPAVVARYARTHPSVSYLLEPTPGASRARNAGAAAASTPYVVFFDDECTAAAGYLSRARELIVQKRPICFGGPVLPRYHAAHPRPAWFKDEYGSFSLPEHNPSDGPPALSAGNLGFERAAFLALGGFDPGLGPAGSRMTYGEENALVAAAARAYGPRRIQYDAALVNYHLVRPEKFRWSHIIRENYLRGIARGRLACSIQENTSEFSTGGNPATPCWPRLSDVLLDLSFGRLWAEPAAYPDPRNVIYERWMGYVRALGYFTGRFLAGRK